jgi:hypothetical protein
MKSMKSQTLISVTETARRLGISAEAAFDLAFVTHELPIVITGNHEGIPESAVDRYRRTHIP